MANLLPLLLLSCLFVVLSHSNSDRIGQLPGQPSVNFEQYAGQVTVDEQRGRVLFYWFYEADHPNASKLPLTLWLNGGPGCSSVGNGALGELGPFRVDKHGEKLLLNQYTWTKASNIIFLESPAGVGFGYTPDDSHSIQNDAQTVSDNLAFLLHFLKEFPQYKHNDFYISGESYAGHYIPTLALGILDHNARNADTDINLKGIAIGNPWTDPKFDDPSYMDFLYSHSIIPEELYNDYKSCNSEDVCAAIEQIASNQMIDVNPYDILEDHEGQCLKKVTQRKGLKLHHKGFEFDGPESCEDPIEVYLNRDAVQAALHVRHRRQWSGCADLPYIDSDIETSMLPNYQKLLKSQLKIWIFSGDMDSVVPTSGTRAWLKALNLTVTDPWFSWDSHGKVGGWGQVYKGITFAGVRGAGHMVPETQPERALDLFRAFLSGTLPHHKSS